MFSRWNFFFSKINRKIWQNLLQRFDILGRFTLQDKAKDNGKDNGKDPQIGLEKFLLKLLWEKLYWH